MCYVKSTPDVIESQADWLTAACHGRKRTDDLKGYIHPLLTAELAHGARPRPWRLQGYVGYMAGRVRWGERENAGLVQLSGDLAERHLERVCELQDSITRLDVATTVVLPFYDSTLARRGYSAATEHRLRHPHSALPKVVEDGNGGSTLYLGDRSSDFILRLYNKQAERLADADPDGAEHYRNAWRYELEVKGRAAPQLATLTVAAPDRAAYIQAFLYDYCEAHGLTPAFPHSGAQALRPGFTRRSDRQKTLQWYRSAVGPSLQRLWQGGDPQELIDALGLADRVSVRPPAPAPPPSDI